MSIPPTQPQPGFPSAPTAAGAPPPIPGNRPDAFPAGPGGFVPPPAPGYAPAYPAPGGAPPGFPVAAPGGYSSYQAHMPQQLYYLGAVIPNFHITNQVGPAVPGFDPNEATEAIRKATKGFGCDDAKLSATLLALSPLKTDAVAKHFQAKVGKNLAEVLKGETSGAYRWGIQALVAGPLMYDCDVVYEAIKGFGTVEDALTEVLIGRSAEDIHMLKDAYRQRYNRDLVEHVRSDLSGKTERLFTIALSGQRTPDNVPVDRALVEKDVLALHTAGQGKAGTDEMVFCDILINRNQPHLAALIDSYNRKYRSLSKVIKAEFSGHMRDAFLHIVQGAKPKRDGQGVWRDAKYIYKAMAGFGCNDAQLVRRVVRAHWDPKRLEAVREAFKQRTGKHPATKIESETKGSYKKLMISLINGEHKMQ